MTEPVASYGGIKWWDNFGEYGFLTKLRSEQLRDIGPSLNPQAAFTLLQGIETLPQRMDAHLANARIVAEWLRTDPRVSFVTWAGLDDHPHAERARRYLPLGPGAVFAFGVAPAGRFEDDAAREAAARKAPRPSGPICNMSRAKMGSSALVPPSSTANMSRLIAPSRSRLPIT